VTDLLVIGYGNDLRCDDGAGRLVADAIAELDLPGVTVRSIAQLTPELALDIAGVGRVVFVDASLDADDVSVERVSPGTGQPGVMTHHGDPAQLLALVATVGEVPGDATVISIPATYLGLGFDLSPVTSSGVAQAIEIIQAMAKRSLTIP
jgi:hydrogenase maturation protease